MLAAACMHVPPPPPASNSCASHDSTRGLICRRLRKATFAALRRVAGGRGSPRLSWFFGHVRGWGGALCEVTPERVSFPARRRLSGGWCWWSLEQGAASVSAWGEASGGTEGFVSLQKERRPTSCRKTLPPHSLLGGKRVV